MRIDKNHFCLEEYGREAIFEDFSSNILIRDW